MLFIVLVMLLIVLVGAAVLAYVAFPHRGADMPVLPQAGRALRRSVEALPVLEEEKVPTRR